MGLILNAIDLILIEKKKQNLNFSNKNILIMGYQDIYFTKEHLNKLFKFHSMENKFVKNSTEENINLKDLFMDIGFKEIDILDNSDYEGANILVNMNNLQNDVSLLKKYDFIFDWGTIEHVYNIPNYLNNIYNFLKKDGYYYGVTPMSGWVEHGFYQFSPVFFRDAFKHNWETIFLKILNFKQNSPTGNWYILSYDYSTMHQYAMGGFDNQLYQNYFLFKKINSKKIDFDIQQSHFKNRWDNIEVSNKINNAEKKDIFKKGIKQKLKDKFVDILNRLFKLFGYKLNIKNIKKKPKEFDSILKNYLELKINSYDKIDINEK